MNHHLKRDMSTYTNLKIQNGRMDIFNEDIHFLGSGGKKSDAAIKWSILYWLMCTNFVAFDE